MKLRSFLLIILLTICGTVQATTSLGDVTLGINMLITDVTCSINNGKDISQQIVIPIVSHDTLRKNSAQSTDVPLLVDCRSSASLPAAISVRLNPAGGGAPVGNGILKTDLAGIGLELSWKNLAGSPPVSLLPDNETIFTTANGAEGIWDLSLFVKPVLVPGEVPDMGRYVGTLQISLKYS